MTNKTQKLAAKILNAHLKSGRIPSGYVLSGASGVSDMAEMAGERHSADMKEEFAAAVAFALESGEHELFSVSDNTLFERIWKRGHPDVKWVGSDLTERSIKIEEVRETIFWASRKPFEGKWKVCIVLRAERLTEEASNAFLKTLEEPPPSTVFFLLTENRDQLLETICSRAFEIRVTPSINNANLDLTGGLDELPIREVFEKYGTIPRDEIKRKHDVFIEICRSKLYRIAMDDNTTDKNFLMNLWLEALDIIRDSKLALELNGNQKLIATRLAMRLARLFPQQKVVLI